MRCTRVLVVSEHGLYPDALGGIELRGRELVDRLSTSCEVTVLTGSAHIDAAGKRRRVNVVKPGPGLTWVRDRLSWSIGSLAFTIAARRTVRNLLRHFRPDVIWLNKFSGMTAPALYELFAWRVPTFLWFGDRWSGANVSTALTLLGATDHIRLVFNCEFLRRFYSPLLDKWDKQTVVYDGVDIARFRPSEIPPAERRFVFSGRTTREKGYLNFCRLMAALPAEFVDSIDIIGDGAHFEQGLDILRRANRHDRLKQAGASDFSVIHERLRAGSILVSPSLDEGLPAAVVEAMACGLTVVASDVGGTAEAVRDGETGMLLAPHDLEGFARACERAARNGALRQRLGDQARRLVIEQFDLDRRLFRTERLLEEALARRAA